MNAQSSLTLPIASDISDSHIVASEPPVSSDDLAMPEHERELVRRLKTGRAALPVLPAVAQSAIRLANDPDARITDLASLVDTDPPIAARFMSVANSVIYFRGWVTSSTQSAIVRLGLAPHVSARLGRFVDRVVPQDFHIDAHERRVLNALGEGQLTARAIGQMLNLSDAVSFMEELTRKLESYSLDLVEPGDPMGGEPTYRLRG